MAQVPVSVRRPDPPFSLPFQPGSKRVDEKIQHVVFGECLGPGAWLQRTFFAECARAARAAEAARNQGKFLEMHDRLYRNQDSWKDMPDPTPAFIGYARELGLNVDRFASELDNSDIEQRIASDMRRGSAAGVTGTPTVFIEGRMLRFEATTPDGLRQGINLMLQQKAVAKP